MSFVLNGVTLPDPNSFSETNELIGAEVTTMTGGRRRAIHAKKKRWRLTWNQLSETDVDTIKDIYDLNETVSFANSALNPAISATVHVDIDPRQYLPGTGKYLSEFGLVLTEI